MTGTRALKSPWVAGASQVLKGSPFEIGFVPAVADPARCLATIIGTDNSERYTEAGREFSVSQELRDRFDNVTLLAGERDCGIKAQSPSPSPSCAVADPTNVQFEPSSSMNPKTYVKS